MPLLLLRGIIGGTNEMEFLLRILVLFQNQLLKKYKKIFL